MIKRKKTKKLTSRIYKKKSSNKKIKDSYKIPKLIGEGLWPMSLQMYE